MDFDSLKTQVSNLTLYDVKAGIRKVQNGRGGPLCVGRKKLIESSSGHELHRNGIESERVGRFCVINKR